MISALHVPLRRSSDVRVGHLSPFMHVKRLPRIARHHAGLEFRVQNHLSVSLPLSVRPMFMVVSFSGDGRRDGLQEKDVFQSLLDVATFLKEETGLIQCIIFLIFVFLQHVSEGRLKSSSPSPSL